MTPDYTTSYQIKDGVLVYTQWIDHDQTVVGRGGFPLSAVAFWETQRGTGPRSDEEKDTYDVVFLNGRQLQFRFPFEHDHGEAWAAFDDNMTDAMRGMTESERGWQGAGITAESQGGGS